MEMPSKARPGLQQLAHLEPGEGMLTYPESGIREPKFKPNWFKSWCPGHGVCQADIVHAGGEPAQGDSGPRPLPSMSPSSLHVLAEILPSLMSMAERGVAGAHPRLAVTVGSSEGPPHLQMGN